MRSNSSSIRFFTAKDVVPGALDNELVAVIGYGHLGRPFALNLRDSGVSRLVVGNTEDEYAQRARADGFRVVAVDEAAAGADIVLVLLPDEVIPEVFAKDIAPHLSPGSAIVFASGYCLAYKLIEPSAEVDVLLLAPRMAGNNARQRYLDDKGFFAYVSVEQETNGKAWPRLLGLADAVGVLRAGAMGIDACGEARLDLFIEQTLGAVLGVAIMSAFAIGEEAGLPPEALIMEMYMSGEMETVWRAFREETFFRASNSHGPTAMFGGFLRAMQFVQSDLAETFQNTMEEIKNGRFAQQFQAEREAGYPMLAQAKAMSNGANGLSEAEARLRAMISGGADLL